MKYKAILFSGVLILLFSASSFISKTIFIIKQGPVSSVEQMSTTVLEILKKNDSNAYAALFVTEKELTEIFKTSSFTEEQKKNILRKMREDSLDTKPKRMFREMQKKLKESAIDWKSYECIENRIELKPENNMETGAFKLRFKCGEKKCMITARKMLKTKNGWKFTKAPYLEIKDQKKEMMYDDAMAVDTTAPGKESMATKKLQEEMKHIADSIARADSMHKTQEWQLRQKKRK